MAYWNFYTSKELKPKGWIKRQLEIQAEGLSGHLDSIWPYIYNSAWIGGSGDGWELMPYWLDGFIPLAYLLENQNMISRVKKYIDAIISLQKEDGWICPCPEEKRAEYDTWPVLLIAKVLTVYYDCSGDERIPDIIYKILKNYYTLLKEDKIKLFNWSKYRWFEGCISIAFTYKKYREEWLLKLAAILKAQGADYNNCTELYKRPLNAPKMETHIVNIAMMLKHEAVSCELLGQNYTDNAEYLYELLTCYNGTAVQTFTGDECLSGLSPIQGTELCAVVELMYSYELLYAYTGEEKWAERLETAAFNALIAAFSDDMWAHQYDQMSNQIACQRFAGKPIFRINDPDAHIFGLQPNYGCCTANFSQGWPKFALSAFMHRENDVINGILIPSELKDKDRHILLETNYPFENSFIYSIEAEEPFNFIIRIPSFAQNVMVNGVKTTEKELIFNIRAHSKKKLLISFDVYPRLKKRPNELYTAQCGSLIFSLPIRYEKRMQEYEADGVIRKFPYCDYEYLPLSPWNYAFSSTQLTRQSQPLGSIPFSSINPPVVLKAKAKKIPWGFEDGYDTVCAKIPEHTAPAEEEEDILLYPYGCAKLRMTELPLLGGGNSDTAEL